MQNDSKNITITEEAKQHLCQNPETVQAIAVALGKSHHTVTRWIWVSRHKFTTPAALAILAKKMGKKQSEITEEIKTKTAA